MTPAEIVEELTRLLGGTTCAHTTANTALRRQIPAAWNLWQDAGGNKWAVFISKGAYFSDVDCNGLKDSIKLGVKPLVVVNDYPALEAVATVYREVGPHLVYPVAGKAALIPPPAFARRRRGLATARSRVTVELLTGVSSLPDLPGPLVVSLKELLASYKRRPANRPLGDTTERTLLLDFARAVLANMGLPADSIATAEMILTIEAGRIGARRDHFFHSFQNYFLGLEAISSLRPHFLNSTVEANLHWNVEPADVWFLTAIWHDVGYSAQEFDRLHSASFGWFEDDEDEDIKGEEVRRLLARAEATEGLRTIALLMSRLMIPALRATAWMAPTPRTRLGAHADGLISAQEKNFGKSHGAFSAIRLYCDSIKHIDDLPPAVGDTLRQTVLLACASMPFHDFWFRKHVREFCGDCVLPVHALPYAALLAFIDSIQDDRRELEFVRRAVLWLQQLLIRPPATLEAIIDLNVLDDRQVLDKIIEGRDVLASLDQTGGDLKFTYPNWIA